MSIKRLRQTEAEQDALVAEQWRDWVAYLRAHTSLLEIRVAERSSALESFEITEGSLEARAVQARRELEALPAARRALFDAVREDRRREVERGLDAERRSGESSVRLLDPDEVERETLALLLEDALGHSTINGHGTVPLDRDTFYTLDIATLEGAPDAQAYRAGAGAGDERRRSLMVVIGTLLCATLSIIIWAIWPSSPHTTSKAALSAHADGLQLVPWTMTTAVLTGSTGAVWSFPLIDQHTRPVTESVIIQDGALMPIQLCLPQRDFGTLLAVRIIGGGMAPEQVYALRPADERPATLVLRMCGPAADAPRWYGTLAATVPREDHTIGQQATLDDGIQAALVSLMVSGAGEDTQIPQDQARVALAIQATAAQDWTRYQPALLLADGTLLNPSELVAPDAQVTFRYLLPHVPLAPLDALWLLTLPESGRAVGWRIRLPPPPTREILLREALEVGEVSAAATETGGLRIVVPVANRGTAPLVLRAEDVALHAGSAPLTPAAVDGLETPLAAKERRAVQLLLPPGAPGTLTLSIGKDRFTIVGSR